MKIKITAYDEVKKEHRCKYLDESKQFSFDTQTSENKVNYTLLPETEIVLNTEPMKNRILFIGCTYNVDGIFYNFTKKNPPELELHIKSAQIL